MTAEKYLSEIERIARSNFQPNGSSNGMTVARLGLLVRKVTGITPEAIGFPRFKDALLELEKRGVLRTGANDKQAFAFWLCTDELNSRTIDSRQTQPANAQPTCAANFKRLKNEIWLAFVSALPIGRRFLNRNSGEIKYGQTEVPDPSQNWVELVPIDQNEDKADAIQFLQEEGLANNPELNNAIEGHAWFHQFAKLLHEIDPSVAFRWKRRRSNRVTTAVESWRSTNNLPTELVYETTSTDRRQLQPRNFKTTEKLDLHELAIRILKGLSVEELLDLSVPIRDVIAVLRPDLLKR